jgi:hypothetical protein
MHISISQAPLLLQKKEREWKEMWPWARRRHRWKSRRDMAGGSRYVRMESPSSKSGKHVLSSGVQDAELDEAPHVGRDPGLAGALLLRLRELAIFDMDGRTVRV